MLLTIRPLSFTLDWTKKIHHFLPVIHGHCVYLFHIITLAVGASNMTCGRKYKELQLEFMKLWAQ